MHKQGNIKLTEDMYVDLEWLISQGYVRSDVFKPYVNSGRIMTFFYIAPKYPLTDKGEMATNVFGRIALSLRWLLEVFRLIKPV